MNLSKLDEILWAATFTGNVALFLILLLRGRWRFFPVFTTLIGFDAALTVLLYLIYAHGSHAWYARVYWTSTGIDFLLQLALVAEITGIVLRPTGTWVRDASKQFALWGLAGVGLAAFAAMGVSPPGLSAREAWEVRGSLFTSLVTCELVTAMAFSATRLGLAWKNHVMALAQGLGAWALAAVAADGIQSYFGRGRSFNTLDHLRIIMYCASLGYWIVRFWLPEPRRLPVAPAMRDYLVALHQRVTYDLDKLHTRD
jgi:hypothetical protein